MSTSVPPAFDPDEDDADMTFAPQPPPRTRRTFVLREAVAMIPLAVRIVADVREARCRLSRLRRRAGDGRFWQGQLDTAVGEADDLGVRITGGVRCELLFPFDHRWVGPGADGRVRPAWFVLDEPDRRIDRWFFDGWPEDRRVVPADWQATLPRPMQAS